MRHLLLAAFILGPGLAFAQTYPPSGQGHVNFVDRFVAANTTHDGHLTLAQAQAAGLRVVVRHFSEIDTTKKGYVTIDDIIAWRKARHLKHHPAPPPAAN
jgi:hypothetical protein